MGFQGENCKVVNFLFQFEHALMIFHRGFRLRAKLYSKSFQQGILKATSIILNTIKTLDFYTDGPQPEKIVPDGKHLIPINFSGLALVEVQEVQVNFQKNIFEPDF